MPDMLVNLLILPDLQPRLNALSDQGVVIRRANVFEISQVRSFIQNDFATSWADEVLVGFSNKPVTVYIAIRDGEVIGFGAYECTRRAYFGPTGVTERERGKGIGKALLLACMHGLRDLGYVYGIIGGAGPIEFYSGALGAIVIPGSEPGIYADRLKRRTEPDD